MYRVKMKRINKGDQAFVAFSSMQHRLYIRSGTRLESAVFLALQVLNAVRKSSMKSSKNSAIVITENPIHRPN